jgi:hypothetical protein
MYILLGSSILCYCFTGMQQHVLSFEVGGVLHPVTATRTDDENNVMSSLLSTGLPATGLVLCNSVAYFYKWACTGELRFTGHSGVRTGCVSAWSTDCTFSASPTIGYTV